MSLFEDFLSIIYPDTCVGCEKELIEGEEIICIHCSQSLIRRDSSQDDEILKNKIGVSIYFESCFRLMDYRKNGYSQNILQKFKYKNRPDIGIYFGEILGEKLKRTLDVDALMPIPLHPKKLKKRGYNQSYLLAKGISQITNTPLVEGLKKHIPRDTQTNKGRVKRWENVKDTFIINEDAFTTHFNHVLLIDDVVTTGATLEACALLLKEYGIEKISICVLAEA